MGTSSGENFHQQLPQGMPPPRHNGGTPNLQTSLSLASSEQVASPDMHERSSNSDPGHDSATESASSRETWPIEPNKSSGGGAASSWGTDGPWHNRRADVALIRSESPCAQSRDSALPYAGTDEDLPAPSFVRNILFASNCGKLSKERHSLFGAAGAR